MSFRYVHAESFNNFSQIIFVRRRVVNNLHFVNNLR